MGRVVGVGGSSKKGGRFGVPSWAWPLGFILMGLGFVALYMLIAMWPSVVNATVTAANTAGTGVGPTGAAGAAGGKAAAKAIAQATTFSWFGWNLSPSTDVALLILVVLAAAVGSFVHEATSFATYAGNRKLVASWIWWYLLRTLIGSSLALIFYFAFRGGFLASGSDSASINPYGVAALSGLVGLFSKQATDKLEEVFTTAFQTKPGAGDDARADSLTGSQPILTEVKPPQWAIGEEGTISLIGSGFTKATEVHVQGPGNSKEAQRVATLVSDTQLDVTLLATDVAEDGTLTITVVNPEQDASTPPSITVAVSNPNPAPILNSTNPPQLTAGQAGPIALIGSGFIDASVVNVTGPSGQGAARAATLISSTQLNVQILAEDAQSGSTLQITVVNPPPGGGSSTALAVQVS